MQNPVAANAHADQQRNYSSTIELMMRACPVKGIPSNN
jgi:hypothetical protein